MNYLPIPEGKPGARGHIGLIAWDPIHQRKIWSVPADGTLVGGLMTTAGGLVFGGRSDGTFSGYAADTGRKLWSLEAGAGVLGAPITYIAGGKQYITVISGVGGINGLRATIASGKTIDYQNQQRRILTFVLDGQFRLATSQQNGIVDQPDPSYRADAAAEKAGAMLYARNCLGCHGIDLQPSGQAPDLRHSLIPQSQEAFMSVLHDGSLVSGGMPMFKELSSQQTEQIRQYIRGIRAKRHDGHSAH